MQTLWTMDTDIAPRPALKHDIITDAVIIGAGLAGIMTAYELTKRGVGCVVLEANRIASGTTCATTGKLTSQQGLIYAGLIKNFGVEWAEAFARANEYAIDWIERTAAESAIDCDFERLSAYLYTTHEPKAIFEEAAAAKRVGIDAHIVKNTALPFKTSAALEFKNQAQFHPLKFIAAIADKLNIYENSPVIRVGSDSLLTPNAIVRAKHIIFCSHFPFVNIPGFYFMRMHEERSYIIALDGVAPLGGMYYGIDGDGLSFRSSGNRLLIAGGNHRTGENPCGRAYEPMLKAAGEYYPDANELIRWSAQDCMTLDNIPYIGRYSPSAPNWFVATGFRKWGMTSSAIAAHIISDIITETDNPYAPIFSPRRFNISASAKSLLSEISHSFKGLTRGAFGIPRESLRALAPGHGGIVEYDGGKVGVYRDNADHCYLVSVRCPHLGCELSWNPDELSWDCPCHGSRFDYMGRLLSNPAMEGLKNEQIDL